MVSRTVTSKPRPGSGLDCRLCARFARHAQRLSVVQPCSVHTRTERSLEAYQGLHFGKSALSFVSRESMKCNIRCGRAVVTPPTRPHPGAPGLGDSSGRTPLLLSSDRAVEWLQRHPEAGSSWPSGPKASDSENSS